MSQTLTLRGLFVQWPWSQLLLEGTKTVEDRKYQLGYQNIGIQGEDHFLVETSQKVSLKRDVLSDTISLPPGPPSGQKHVVGIIRFGSQAKYESLSSWQKASGKHCINPDSNTQTCGWDGSGDRYAWEVESVQRVQPLLINAGGMRGFVAKSLELTPVHASTEARQPLACLSVGDSLGPSHRVLRCP